MSSRLIFLIIYAAPQGRRAHFSIWVPEEEDAPEGTIIHVIGGPPFGFKLEFKRKYKPEATQRIKQVIPIGSVLAEHLHHSGSNPGAQDMPRNNLERAATQIQPPRANPDFLTVSVE